MSDWEPLAPKRRGARRRRHATSTSPTWSPDFDEAFFGSGGSPRSATWSRSGSPPGRTEPVRRPRIGAPIARPHQILCIGLNYSDHAAETGQAVPDEPILFTKSPNTLVGPNDDVRIPRGSTKTDWEVELGIVIGRRASYLDDEEPRPRTPSPATCSSTTSASGRSRSSAAASGPRASRRETFNPAGPWLVTPDEIGDVLDLDMWLDVNGVRRQTGSTSTMVFSPYLHRALPEPVPGPRAGRPDQHRHPARASAWASTPPVLLQAGDVMELGIDAPRHARRQHVIAPR